MKKLIVGFAVATALATTTGLASALNGGVQDHNGYLKDQCKNGGWQELGFKNQGECVSFFTRNENAAENSNVNNFDVSTHTEGRAEGGSVEISGSAVGEARGGDASNISSTEVGISVGN